MASRAEQLAAWQAGRRAGRTREPLKDVNGPSYNARKSTANSPRGTGFKPEARASVSRREPDAASLSAPSMPGSPEPSAAPSPRALSSEASALYAALVAEAPGAAAAAEQWVNAHEKDAPAKELALYWLLASAVAETSPADSPVNEAQRWVGAVKAVHTGLRCGAAPRSVLVEKGELLFTAITNLSDESSMDSNLARLLTNSLRTALGSVPEPRASPPSALARTSRLHARVVSAAQPAKVLWPSSPLPEDAALTLPSPKGACSPSTPVWRGNDRREVRNGAAGDELWGAAAEGVRAPPPSPSAAYRRRLHRATADVDLAIELLRES